MSTDNAKPRAKAANSSSPRRPASTSSPSNRSSSVRRAPAADANASGERGKGTLRKSERRRSHRRFAIDEALRCEGMDEPKMAQEFGVFFSMLGKKDSTAILKLRLDGLKEWIRALTPQRASSATAEPEPPVIMQLVHAVPRPARATSESRNASLETRPDTSFDESSAASPAL